MKIIRIIRLLFLSGFFGVFVISCEKVVEDSNEAEGAEGYEYWQGDLPNSYYLLNIDGKRARKIKGKPFIVLKHNRVTHDITDCEIGLSEVTQEVIPSVDAVPPEPTLDAKTIDFHSKLNLKNPIDLIVSWNTNLPGSGGKSTITNGFQNFSFRSGYQMAFNVGHNEEWSFSYNSVSMVGGVKNIDDYLFSGRESENNSFNLRKRY